MKKMRQEQIKKINNLFDLLTEENKKQAIIEINETENKIIYDFLEMEGFLNISYKVEYNKIPIIMSENSGSLDLWHKNLNKTWTINMFQINRMLKANWKKSEKPT